MHASACSLTHPCAVAVDSRAERAPVAGCGNASARRGTARVASKLQVRGPASRPSDSGDDATSGLVAAAVEAALADLRDATTSHPRGTGAPLTKVARQAAQGGIAAGDRDAGTEARRPRRLAGHTLGTDGHR